MGRIMAIDYGEKRVGISLTDPLNIIVSPYLTLKNDNNIFLNIIKICKEKKVEIIVIGMPFNKEYKTGFAAKKVIKFMNNLIQLFLKEGLNITFYEQDESFSTREAYDKIKKVKLKNKKEKIDAIASTNILNDFIASKNKILYDFEKYKNLI